MMQVELRAAVLNVLWGASGLRAWRDYSASLSRPREAQRTLLLRCLHQNRDTVYGRRYGFASIRSVEEYQARVPVVTCDELEPMMRRVAAGEAGVLTQAAVSRLMPSGGSTAAAKLIPSTAPLRAEFNRAIRAWLVDVIATRPAVLGGRAYWSITPPAAIQVTQRAAIPVGFEHDADYLGGPWARLVGALMAVPGEVATLRDMNAFRYATALFLLRAPDLRLISVWHPSFLEGLLDLIDEARDSFVRDIACGTFSPPSAKAPNADGRCLRPWLSADPARAAAVERARDIRDLWPRLALISAWADGHSRGPANGLRQRFRGVELQAKGLLATEGIVTIPFRGQHPLAIRSHFFEFIDRTGAALLAHELEDGQEYSVVLTTGGGLYRYRLGDRVKVDGFCEATPSLRFIGRDDRVADWFGEKLSDGFVANALDNLFRDAAPRFAMLAPERYDTGLAYTLFADETAARAPHLAQQLERELRRNPHYAWCVDLGQLRPARVVAVDRGATQAYLEACIARGQRLGDVKPAALQTGTGWTDVLARRAPMLERSSC